MEIKVTKKKIISKIEIGNEYIAEMHYVVDKEDTQVFIFLFKRLFGTAKKLCIYNEIEKTSLGNLYEDKLRDIILSLNETDLDEIWLNFIREELKKEEDEAAQAKIDSQN